MSVEQKMFDSDDIPTIPEFYRGRKIFITGGSGFMGKVLVEKLLRSCPDLDTIYLLLRPKKGKTPSSRVKVITDTPLFDRLKEENPTTLSKLFAISGDVKELGLGLSSEDKEMLQNEVSVIFHCAASIRFDDLIKDAVLINVRGTREVINLAMGMPKLMVLLHLSTTYCNCDLPVVLEEVYPAPGDWRTMIKLSEAEDEQYLLQCLALKITKTLPNTYTYAKALGEQVVKDHQHLLPLVIVRPSIVIPAASEPMPGWTDSFSGPLGIMVTGAKGVLRSFYADPDNIGDYVPVDVAVRSMIFIAWQRATSSDSRSTPVYNCCSMTLPTSLQEFIDMGHDNIRDKPMMNIFWQPTRPLTHNRCEHFVKVILFHLLPALLIDGLLLLSGKKPMLTKLQRRIFIANMTLAIFITRKNTFSNTKFVNLESDFMKPSDVKDFSYNQVLTDFTGYVRNMAFGTRLYLMKEPLDTLAQSKMHANRMYWLDKVCKLLVVLSFLWFIDACAMVRAVLHPVFILPEYIVDTN